MLVEINVSSCQFTVNIFIRISQGGACIHSNIKIDRNVSKYSINKICIQNKKKIKTSSKKLTNLCVMSEHVE